MLLAGKNTQANLDYAIVTNSKEQDAWKKLGNLKFSTCNDGDLLEWFIGHDIPVLFKRRFWTSDDARTRMDLEGYCVDLLTHSNGNPPEAIIHVYEPVKTNKKQLTVKETEVLLSMDPTVDGTKEIHRNCLREAVKDTYQETLGPDMTLQDILQESSKFDELVGSSVPTSGRKRQTRDADSSNDSESESESDNAEPQAPKRSDKPDSEPAPSQPEGEQPKQQQRKSKRRRGQASSKADSTSADPKGKQPAKRKSNGLALHIQHTVRDMISATQRFFNARTEFGARLDNLQRRKKEFEMRGDTEGATVVAFLATMTVCQMAASFGYEAAFIPPEPKNQRQARTWPDAHLWESAENKELDTLWKMGTFKLVDKPANYDPLPLQFVYKLKVKDGDFNNCTYKARLVMMGNLQYDSEYGDTYAPTAKLWVIRTMAAIAAQEGLTMKKFDLTGAFLVADMPPDQQLYVQIPGYDLPTGKAILLKKALYGGKSSGALYYKEVSTWLKAYGFETCSVDETLFRLTRVKPDGTTSTLLISLYVDDGACCTNDEQLYQEFLTAFGQKYDLSDAGDLSWHLGMKFTQDPENGTISIDQSAYIDAVLKRFSMEDCTEKETSLPPHHNMDSSDCPKEPVKQDVKVYQQLIGSLMYIACGTRPDIAYAVNSCAQFMQNPGQSHLKAAKHILRYLKATRNNRLTYRRQQASMANKLYGYVDADHAACKDTRRSVGGYVLMLNGAAVSWSSRKIKVVSISSFESEWYSASICGCEIVVMRRLLEEMGKPQASPTVLFEDNAGCIFTATHPERPMNPRSKHIDTRVFKLREFVQDGTLELNKIASTCNVADCLTKSLDRDAVKRTREYMLGLKV